MLVAVEGFIKMLGFVTVTLPALLYNVSHLLLFEAKGCQGKSLLVKSRFILFLLRKYRICIKFCDELVSSS
jgi:hypothetical protein